MSPSHFLCWDSLRLSLPSHTFQEVLLKSPAAPHKSEHPHAGAWGGSWTRQRQLLYLTSIHFLKNSCRFFTFKRDLPQPLVYFIFISIFFSKFVIERDRSPCGTLDSGCTGVLLLLAAAPCQEKAARRPPLVRAEGSTMPSSFHSPHNTGHKALLSDSCGEPNNLWLN